MDVQGLDTADNNIPTSKKGQLRDRRGTGNGRGEGTWLRRSGDIVHALDVPVRGFDSSREDRRLKTVSSLYCEVGRGEDPKAWPGGRRR